MTRADEGTATAGRHVAAGAGERIWFTNNLMTLKATSETTGGAYALMEAVAPAGSGPPLHVHHREDESFWVLEGVLSVWCGEEMFTAAAGDYVFLPRDVPHTFAIEGEEPARILSMATPGGLEGYFATVGRPAEGNGLPPAGAIDVARLASVGEAFGLEILGPPRRPLGR
ncbi:MAG TPA: quercetin 2,3-dioxygenase [Solirubrobacteraceae bacterium]|nr:quercetin 2,3-dioxygenase [Solirubrobacteraceae bacterium]